jgi:uncharacterized protein (TIGR03382 family)
MDTGNVDSSGGGPGDSSGLGTDDTGTPPGDTGSDGTGSGLTGEPTPPTDPGGCGCTSGRSGGSSLPWLMAVAGLVLRRRRRAA